VVALRAISRFRLGFQPSGSRRRQVGRHGGQRRYRRGSGEMPSASVRHASRGGANVHLHVLCLDGVYVRDTESGRLVFEALGTPSHDFYADSCAFVYSDEGVDQVGCFKGNQTSRASTIFRELDLSKL
jgi:hypothetical protein